MGFAYDSYFAGIGLPAIGEISQAMIYERYLGPQEFAALYAAPDLPIWRPRRGISLALLGESGSGGAGAVYRPWLMTGGRMR
jgi:hypothetical protein